MDLAVNMAAVLRGSLDALGLSAQSPTLLPGLDSALQLCVNLAIMFNNLHTTVVK